MDYSKDSLAYKFVNGNIGYGSICISDNIIDYILLILFPPIYVITFQIKNYISSKETDNNKLLDNLDVGQIITSLILTSCFYFPGLLHAFYIKTNKESCDSIFK